MFPQQYAAQRIELVHGKGVYVFDAAEKRYLDFSAGISVNAFGYGDPDFARIASQQMEKLIHVSNLFVTTPARELATKLLDVFPTMSCVHFGNSGTEAIEAAIKYARMYAMQNKGAGHSKLIAFEHCFHGRSFGAASLNAGSVKNTLIHPLLPDCVQIPYNDHAAMKAHIDAQCAAVFVEPVQGEGGLDCLTKESAAILQDICAEHDVLIVADEIQTGLGRLGRWTGSEEIGLHPDIVALSKPLAAGLPLSALLIPERVNICIPFAAHGTTFGGGPVSCALALEVLRRIGDPTFFSKVQKTAHHLYSKLQGIVENHKGSLSIKGKGLLCGIKLAQTHALLRNQIIEATAEKGLLILPSGSDVLRIAPPLTISIQEIDEGIAILQDSIATCLNRQA